MGATDNLRKPLFIVALILIAVAVLLEIGSGLVAGLFSGGGTLGVGITVLSFLDGILLYTLGLIGFALIFPEKVVGRLQGVITFVFAILMLVGTVLAILAILVLLLLMVSLLIAIPFGTIVYLAKWGTFKTTEARVTLGLIIGLKEAAVVCLLLAHHRFLENKGLVLLTLTSLVGTILVSFLHGLVPGFLVSLTDAASAIVVCVLAAIWAVFFLVGSIPAIKRLLPV